MVETEPGRAWVRLLAIPIAVSAWVIARSLYYRGYAEQLGVPDEVALVPSASIWAIVGGATVAVILLVGVTGGMARLLESPHLLSRRIGAGVAGLCLVLALLLVDREIFDMSPAVAVTEIVILAAILGLVWLVRRRGKSDGARTVVKKPSATESIAQSEWSPSVIAVLSVVVLMFGSARVIGRWHARSKDTWVTVTHPSLPATDSVSWVIVGSSDDSFLVARVVGDTVLYPFRTLRASAETVGFAFEP